MISGSSAIGSEWFLNGIANLQRQQIKTQQQLSSGFRIQDASDSPSQTAELIGLGSGLANLQSYQTNLGRVQTEATSADTALGSGIKLLDQARSLAVQGSNTISTASDRNDLAAQIQSIQDQFVALANTTSEGRYIFSGDQDQSAAYRTDNTSSTGVSPVANGVSTRVITNPAGQTVYASNTASAIFDPRDSSGVPTAANTFAALQQLKLGLQNNDTTGIAASLSSLQTSADWLNEQQAGYGTAGQRLTQEQNDTASQITSLQARISGVRDTDVAKAATDLAQENVSQSAAFSAQAAVPRKSLFDYLA